MTRNDICSFVLQAMYSGQDTMTIVVELCTHCRQIILCEHVVLIGKNFDGTFLNYTSECKPNSATTHMTSAQSVIGIVCNTGLTFISNNLAHDKRRGSTIHGPLGSFVFPRETLLPEGHPAMQNVMVVPLWFQAQLVGTLVLANRRDEHGAPRDFKSEDEPKIKYLCWLMGLVIGFDVCKMQQEMVNTQLQHQQEISSAKDAFLATMSHEIRTPLNGIMGMARMLRDSELNEEQAEYIDVISTCSVQLLGILNDILDYSKMVAGRFVLEPTDFRPIKLIEEAYSVVIATAQEKGLDINYVIDDNVPYFLRGDQKRIRQIVVNLLSNAVKFTESGSVHTRLWCDDDVNNYNHCDAQGNSTLVCIQVTDTGIGMASSQIVRVFEPFNQIDSRLTRVHGGTGLGLAIVKKLVDLMHGTVKIDSRESEGTTVTVQLLLQTSNTQSPTTEMIRNIDMTDKTVLVVDDNITNRMILCSQFIKWGMRPVTAASGEEALMFVKNKYHFDIAFLDICMPDMSGVELAQKIKRLSPQLPLIALSSGNQVHGADAKMFSSRLLKPVKESSLLRAIGKALLLLPTESEAPTPTPFATHAHEDSLRILVAEDVVQSQKVIIAFLKKLGYRNVDMVSDGYTCVQHVKKALREAEPYHVVLMDLKMPFMNGYVAAKNIGNLDLRKFDKTFGRPRSNGTMPSLDGVWSAHHDAGARSPGGARSPQATRSPRIPTRARSSRVVPTQHKEALFLPQIVALTATVLERDKQRAKEAGMIAFLSKPIRMEELEATLNVIARSFE